MRFSAAFDSFFMPSVQDEDRVLPAQAQPKAVEPVAPEELEDLAERVRRVGEWQLEDW